MKKNENRQLVSRRLIFTPYTEEDLEKYLQLVTDERIMKHITFRALSLEEGKARFEKVLTINRRDSQTGNFMVSLSDGGIYIGLAKLVPTEEQEAEVGYALLPGFLGQAVRY